MNGLLSLFVTATLLLACGPVSAKEAATGGLQVSADNALQMSIAAAGLFAKGQTNSRGAQAAPGPVATPNPQAGPMTGIANMGPLTVLGQLPSNPPRQFGAAPQQR